MNDTTVRLANPPDARGIATLLHDFNTEFDVSTPGPDVLESRLVKLLAGHETLAIVAGSPMSGCALVTLRPNVWYEGKVALLDELYVSPLQRNNGIGSLIIKELLSVASAFDIERVEINVDESDIDAQRFYERHRFSIIDPDSGERAFYYSLDLGE